jgi:hypothetical protein
LTRVPDEMTSREKIKNQPAALMHKGWRHADNLR